MPKRVSDHKADDLDSAPNRGNGEPTLESTGIPRWRKIEIMRERAALREALGDDELDLEALESEVFGTEEEYWSLYRHGDSEDEIEAEIEGELLDDDFDDDDDETFDED
ncbi:MAG: hypothetical protein R3348_08845 [Xanthomonadales bacterium]|nr:hypothetical protein [Xanthomonadales bacterium]